MIRRTIPLGIAFFAGLFMIVQFFVPHEVSQSAMKHATRWSNLIFAASLALGILSLVKYNLIKIQRKSDRWGYALVTLIALLIMCTLGMMKEVQGVFEAILPTGAFCWMQNIGFFHAMEPGGLFYKLFAHILIPLEATTFSLLAFYIASAAFRAFRARNLEATLLLIAAFIVMIGRVPIGHLVSQMLYFVDLGKLAEWILDYPNTGAKRAIMMGVGLGMISTAVKIILGIERTYIGGGD